MFDLNLNVDYDGNDEFLPDSPGVKSPATSVSSVVNGEGDSSSSNDEVALAFNFGIVGDDDRDVRLAPIGSGLVTRELFPMGRPDEPRQIGQQWRSMWLDQGPEVQQLQRQVQQAQARKSRRGPRSKSSQYRGVTFYRRTGRWESHIWDCGKQVYLGGFDTALAAARAYDRAAIKFRGVGADINFNLSDYDQDMNQTKNLSKEEFVHILRRQSTGFSRGTSKYRGVTLHKCGRWEARMGQYLGKKAYDNAVIKYSGRDTVTNFELSSYKKPHDEGLDLNLGISTTSSPKDQSHSSDVNNARTLKLHMESYASVRAGIPSGLAVTPEQQILSSGLNLKFTPNYQRLMLSEPSRGSIPREAMGTWDRQMHDRIYPNPNAFAAASSGFLSPAARTGFPGNSAGGGSIFLPPFPATNSQNSPS